MYTDKHKTSTSHDIVSLFSQNRRANAFMLVIGRDNHTKLSICRISDPPLSHCLCYRFLALLVRHIFYCALPGFSRMRAFSPFRFLRTTTPSLSLLKFSATELSFPQNHIFFPQNHPRFSHE